MRADLNTRMIPFNLASYGLLLHLLAQEAGLEPGQLTGMLCDVHLYTNHEEQARVQLTRTPFELPRITTELESIFSWEASYTTFVGEYLHHKSIKAPIAV